MCYLHINGTCFSLLFTSKKKNYNNKKEKRDRKKNLQSIDFLSLFENRKKNVSQHEMTITMISVSKITKGNKTFFLSVFVLTKYHGHQSGSFFFRLFNIQWKLRQNQNKFFSYFIPLDNMHYVYTDKRILPSKKNKKWKYILLVSNRKFFNFIQNWIKIHTHFTLWRIPSTFQRSIFFTFSFFFSIFLYLSLLIFYTFFLSSLFTKYLQKKANISVILKLFTQFLFNLTCLSNHSSLTYFLINSSLIYFFFGLYAFCHNTMLKCLNIFLSHCFWHRWLDVDLHIKAIFKWNIWRSFYFASF